MNDKIFVDTNVLVYAHDADAGEKHLTARDLVSRFGKVGQGFSAPRSFRNSFAGNAAVIAAEDLNHGQRIEGILIRNPFAEDLPGSESGSQA
jgi:predicted nucleic acid-binding protein